MVAIQPKVWLSEEIFQQKSFYLNPPNFMLKVHFIRVEFTYYWILQHKHKRIHPRLEDTITIMYITVVFSVR